jgi:hypothetical protein
VLAEARRRGVVQVVHFTTHIGAVGILASGAIKSRRLLPEDAYLERIYRPNADLRKDPEWLDYVNLSITRINDWMFSSSVGWHAEDGVEWLLFVFDPEILADPGVVFTTTNNIYPSVLRGEGMSGFDRLFASAVRGRYQQVHRRTPDVPDSHTTDHQAEVLYPRILGLDHLLRIDAQTGDGADAVAGTAGALGLDVEIRVAPEAFQ